MVAARRSPGGAASHVFAVRLTAAEQEALGRAASARSVEPRELFRAWIAGGACIETAATAPSYVIARERPGVEVEFWSRWVPRHVWTLHRVPGRLDGPVLAVRRRVLGMGYDFSVETPGGDAGLDDDDLAKHGVLRSRGSSRYDERREPGPTGWGRDLEIDVYDHVPSEEERADWLTRRRLLSAAISNPPRHAYLAAPNKAGKYTARKVSICRRWLHWGDGGRFDLEHAGSADRKGAFDAGNLRELVERGWSSVDVERRLYLVAPSKDALAELEIANRKRVDIEEKTKREARDFAEALRGAFRSAEAEPPGAVALRSFGLDPKIATAAALQTAFRDAAVKGHADMGGAADMGDLVKRRDLARGYIDARQA